MSDLPEFRPVVDAPGYYAGSDGAIYTIRRREAFPRSKRLPYLSVVVFKDGMRLRRFVHRLVAEAFHGTSPVGHQCRHLDGDPTNNRPENLRWGTALENAADRTAHGRSGIGERNASSKLLDSDVMDIRARYRDGDRVSEIATEYGIHVKHAYNVAVGRAWAHLPGATRRAA